MCNTRFLEFTNITIIFKNKGSKTDLNNKREVFNVMTARSIIEKISIKDRVIPIFAVEKNRIIRDNHECCSKFCHTRGWHKFMWLVKMFYRSALVIWSCFCLFFIDVLIAPMVRLAVETKKLSLGTFDIIF